MLAHGALDADLSDVLPALRKDRGQEVEGLDDVSSDLLRSLSLLSDGGVDPSDTLDLESGSVVELFDLLLNAAAFWDNDRESLNRGKWFTDGLCQVLVQSRRDEDHVVASGPLLDELQVIVELLEVIHINKLDVVLDALISVNVINDADQFELSLDLIWKIDISCQLLLLLSIVVSQRDLELNSLRELSWLALSLHFLNVGQQLVLSKFAKVRESLPTSL